jgi:hypothetical protein
MSSRELESSRALWNRSACDLADDEVLAQLLDRGEMATWREIYRRAAGDPALRRRIKRLVLTVPLPLPRFWLCALSRLGEPVDVDAALPAYDQNAV